MAQNTEQTKVTPSAWEHALEKIYGGVPCGEMIILSAKANTGKSMLAQRTTEQKTDGI